MNKDLLSDMFENVMNLWSLMWPDNPSEGNVLVEKILRIQDTPNATVDEYVGAMNELNALCVQIIENNTGTPQ